MSRSGSALYHWSPRERRASINSIGLTLGNRNVMGPTLHGTGPDGAPIVDSNGDTEFFQPAICFASSPADAWNYSHGTWRTEGIFDLWQVYPAETDEIHISPQWGAYFTEIRIHNNIPESRLIRVGERSVVPAPLELDPLKMVNQALQSGAGVADVIAIAQRAAERISVMPISPEPRQVEATGANAFVRQGAILRGLTGVIAF